MVMLGVTAERVFDLVCEALGPALGSAKEQASFSKLMPKRSMRPKVDWVHDKLRRIEDGRPPKDYPERASALVTSLYELVRVQRNDLGHPQEAPPRLSREEVSTHLQVFPTYYANAERLRSFLKVNQVQIRATAGRPAR